MDIERSLPRFVVAIGTRPEAVKLAPVIAELRARAATLREPDPVFVCTTGQHTEAVREVLALYGITPNHDLAVLTPGQSLASLSARVLSGFESVLQQRRPTGPARRHVSLSPGVIRRHPPPARVLITAHRRENQEHGLDNLCLAINELVARNPGRYQFVWPQHPNLQIGAVARHHLASTPGVTLTPPVAYDRLLKFLHRSDLVLTDSGGIQEEAPSFGKPVLILREATERPEGIDAGLAWLVGTDPDRIIAAVERLTRRIEAGAHFYQPNPTATVAPPAASPITSTACRSPNSTPAIQPPAAPAPGHPRPPSHPLTHHPTNPPKRARQHRAGSQIHALSSRGTKLSS